MASRPGAFPIPSGQAARLSGGFWARDSRSPALEQERVFAEVRPAGRRGTLFVEIRLAAPVWESADPEPPRRVSLSFPADYATIQAFARSVAAVAAGRSDEANLESDVTYA